MKIVNHFTCGKRELVMSHRAAVSMVSVHCLLLGTPSKLMTARIETIVTVNFTFYFSCAT